MDVEITSNVEINNCKNVSINGCRFGELPIDIDLLGVGVVATNSNVHVNNCEVSDKDIGLLGKDLSKLVSNNNTGAFNVVALQAETGGHIYKVNATQPLGSTVTKTGGHIF